MCSESQLNGIGMDLTEEDKVFEVKERHSEIKLLIEQLEQREDEKKDEKQEEQT